jgi:hypothetical protein
MKNKTTVYCLTCGGALERRPDGNERGYACYTWHAPTDGRILSDCPHCGARALSLLTTSTERRMCTIPLLGRILGGLMRKDLSPTQEEALRAALIQVLALDTDAVATAGTTQFGG